MTLSAASTLNSKIEIGVIAIIAASTTSEKNQMTQVLPDPTVPGFLTFNPAIALGLDAAVSVEALGGLVAGYELNWPHITAHFDISCLWAIYCGHRAQHNARYPIDGLVTLPCIIDTSWTGNTKQGFVLVDKPETDPATEVIVVQGNPDRSNGREPSSALERTSCLALEVQLRQSFLW